LMAVALKKVWDNNIWIDVLRTILDEALFNINHLFAQGARGKQIKMRSLNLLGDLWQI
jgi:hypothetical protein